MIGFLSKMYQSTRGLLGVNVGASATGSGKAADGTHDVIATTKDKVAVGDVVKARGTVRTGVKLGSGYSYDVLTEVAVLREVGGAPGHEVPRGGGRTRRVPGPGARRHARRGSRRRDAARRAALRAHPRLPQALGFPRQAPRDQRVGELCGPCRAEMGSLDRLARRHNGRQFHVIGISTDDHADKAQAFVVGAGVSFDNYIDRNLVLENMLGANRIPLTRSPRRRGFRGG